MTQDELLSKMSDFSEMLADAPDDPTSEEIEATQVERDKAALAARQAVVLSPDAGWPSKCLWDVQNTPLRGDKWFRAYADAAIVLKNGGIVILHGDRGPGKTRMAAELSVMMGRGEYRKAMQFFLDVRATYNTRSELTERDIIDELASPRMIVIDEMQVRGGKPFEDNLLTHLIDERYASRLPTIMIANLTHEQLGASLGASIVDRVSENGAVINCDWPSFRTN